MKAAALTPPRFRSPRRRQPVDRPPHGAPGRSGEQQPPERKPQPDAQGYDGGQGHGSILAVVIGFVTTAAIALRTFVLTGGTLVLAVQFAVVTVAGVV
jgi:hypothetical protein